jgi:hypothetical protein
MGQHRSRGRSPGARRTRRGVAAPAWRAARPSLRRGPARRDRSRAAIAGERRDRTRPATAGETEASRHSSPGGAAAAPRAGAAGQAGETSARTGPAVRARTDLRAGGAPRAGGKRQRPGRARVRGAVAACASWVEGGTRSVRALAWARSLLGSSREGAPPRSLPRTAGHPGPGPVNRDSSGSRGPRCYSSPTAAARRPLRRRRPSCGCPRAGRRSSRPGRAA